MKVVCFSVKAAGWQGKCDCREQIVRTGGLVRKKSSGSARLPWTVRRPCILLELFEYFLQ